MKKRMIWPIMVVVTLLTVSCSKTDVGSGWLNKMKQAAELSTVQYTVQKVVSNNDESWRIFGDRKILFSFKAVIKAGIDMEKFDATKVRVVESRRDKKKKIWLELPQPRILSYNIRPDDVKQLYSEVSLLRTEYSNEERDAIVTKGEMELKMDRELTEMILRDARLNAEVFMKMLLLRNGFTDVYISFNGEDSHGII
jgi:hypothetical protein